jgi:hypothetical protein
LTVDLVGKSSLAKTSRTHDRQHLDIFIPFFLGKPLDAHKLTYFLIEPWQPGIDPRAARVQSRVNEIIPFVPFT